MPRKSGAATVIGTGWRERTLATSRRRSGRVEGWVRGWELIPSLDRGPIVDDESGMSTSCKFFTTTLIASTLLIATTVAQGTGRWTSGAAMPSERTEVAVAEVADKIYVLGGFREELEL